MTSPPQESRPAESLAAESPIQIQEQSNPVWATVGCVAIIIVTTIAAMWPVLSCGFTAWDDPMTVASNPYLKPPNVHSLIYFWTHAAMGLYVPLTYSVWWAIAILAGDEINIGKYDLDPTLFHAANLLLHVMSAIVVFLILRRILRASWKHGDFAACIGAMLFALHPIQVEAVAWVSGLKDLLSGLLILIAIWQYIGFVDAPPKSMQRIARYVIVLAAAGFAMLAKPSAMVLPAILVLMDWLILGRTAREILYGVAPVLLVCLPCTILAMVIQHPPGHVHIWRRLMVVMDSISFYAIKLVWPVHLTNDYARRPTDVLGDHWIAWCWVIPLLVVIGLWMARKRLPLVGAGVLLFFVTVAPTLGFVNTLFQDKSTVADHYLYVPMLGITLAVAAILGRFHYKVLYALAALVLVFFGVLSFRQAEYWHDSYTLFSHTVDVSPRSWAGRLGLASVLIEQKKFPEAEPYVRQATEIYPWSTTYLTLGKLLLMEKRPADAIDPLERAVALEPGIDGGRMNLASAYLEAERKADAIRQVRQYISEHPDDPRAQKILKDVENY